MTERRAQSRPLHRFAVPLPRTRGRSRYPAGGVTPPPPRLRLGPSLSPPGEGLEGRDAPQEDQKEKAPEVSLRGLRFVSRS